MQDLKNLTILYLEDEDLIRENIAQILGYLFKNVVEATNYDEAIQKYENNNINIILSDITMAGKNGLDFVKYIRNSNNNIPIILLTAHTDTKFLLDAIKLNLVDYLRKPVNFNELKSTLKKAAEIYFENNDFVINFPDNIEYNFSKKQLFQDNKQVEVTKKEIALLEFLYKNKSRTVPKDEIMNYVWEDGYLVTESAFKSLMNKLRKKIGKNSIKNMSKVGYQISFIEN